jgi:hypothetical protein
MPGVRRHPSLDGAETTREHKVPAGSVKPGWKEPAHAFAMKELFRTNDAVRLSWAEALLAAAGIAAVVLDTHTSILEGSIGAIQRRLMVPDADLARARVLLKERGGLKDRV